MKTWWSVALGVVFGLLAAGVVFLASSPPRGEAIALLPPPTPIPLQVHISGAVLDPGVYTHAAPGGTHPRCHPGSRWFLRGGRQGGPEPGSAIARWRQIARAAQSPEGHSRGTG